MSSQTNTKTADTSMKLYVWEDPYPTSYGSSLLFAVASNLRQAKAVATQKWKTLYPTSREVNLGQPTRVSPLPCAEWHEWSE